MSQWIKETAVDIPQQGEKNVTDCVVFICKYAEFMSRRAPLTFSQEDMKHFRMKMKYEIISGVLL